MKISDLIPESRDLSKLGFRRKPRQTSASLFGVRNPPRHSRELIKPDVDYHPEAEREPQASKYTQMWLDHWSHWGDVKNPVGNPMESGA